MANKFIEVIKKYKFDIDQIVYHFNLEVQQSQAESRWSLDKQFQVLIDELKDLRPDQNQMKTFLYETMHRICIDQLNYHKRVAQFNVSYKVLPFIELGGNGIKSEDIDTKISLFKSKLKYHKCLNKSKKTIFVLAQLHLLNGQKYQALHYFDCLKQILDKKEDLLLRASIQKLKLLISFDDYNVQEISKNIKDLQNLYQNEQISFDVKIQKRNNDILLFFQMSLDYLEQNESKQKQAIKELLEDESREGYLHLFYNLQITEALTQIQPLYRQLFDPHLFELFNILYNYKNGQQNSCFKCMLKKFFLNNEKCWIYQYGKGKNTMITLIHAILLCEQGKFQESKESIVEIFNNFKNKYSNQLNIFLNFFLEQTKYCESASKNKQPDFENVNVFKKTFFSVLEQGVFKGKNYILKTSQSANMDELLKKEACLQEVLKSRYFLKTAYVYRNNNNQLVNVYPKEGNDLQVTLEQQKKEGKVNELQNIYIILQIIDAICLLHQKKIAHGDIKLNNILLKSDDNTKIFVIDLNISTINLFTLFFQLFGFNNFSADEQINSKNCTLRSDIYQLGNLIKEILKDSKYQSLELKQLIKQMNEQKQLQRCDITYVQLHFRLHAFITILYKQLEKKNNCTYQNFYTFVYNMFQQFQYQIINLNDSTKNQELNWNELKSEKLDFQKIKNLLIKLKLNQIYLDCLKEKKIKKFVENILKDEQNQTNKEQKIHKMIIKQMIRKQLKLKQQNLNKKEIKENKILNKHKLKTSICKIFKMRMLKKFQKSDQKIKLLNDKLDNQRVKDSQDDNKINDKKIIETDIIEFEQKGNQSEQNIEQEEVENINLLDIQDETNFKEDFEEKRQYILKTLINYYSYGSDQ
ncbi:hypothetical protein ABPG74_001244 [Tetrahymena malaccensis]